MNEDNQYNEFYTSTTSYVRKPPKVIQFIINHSGGLIKTEKQANIVALIFVVITLVISIMLFSGTKEDKDLEYAPAVDAPAEALIPQKR